MVLHLYSGLSGRSAGGGLLTSSLTLAWASSGADLGCEIPDLPGRRTLASTPPIPDLSQNLALSVSSQLLGGHVKRHCESQPRRQWTQNLDLLLVKHTSRMSKFARLSPLGNAQAAAIACYGNLASNHLKVRQVMCCSEGRERGRG